MAPNPIIPKVYPLIPLAFENSSLFHFFSFLNEMTLSAIFLSNESINPINNSATAIEFLPGQFPTNIPWALALFKSMLS